MPRLQKPELWINVPYYKQTSKFSCGPACAVMVLKYFDKKLAANRQLEYELWRDTNIIGIPGCDMFGLAIPFLRRKFQVTGLTRGVWAPRKEVLSKFVSEEEAELTVFALRTQREKAKRLGINLRIEEPRLDIIHAALEKGQVPLVMVNMHGVPHWVVVTGVGEKEVVYNDPYFPKGRTPPKDLSIIKRKFQSRMDHLTTRFMIKKNMLLISANGK